MLFLSLVSFAIATVTACLSVISQEEVVKVAMAFAALLASLTTLFLAPWVIKLLIMSIPFGLDKMSKRSAENFTN
ncbi:MAG: riboflavin synthase subunit alpha [Cyanophyceae cyanobacterium]